MTHQHYDHNRLELPAKNPGCVIWQNTDALQNGVYQTLTLDFATAEAVEAYNHHHPKAECVGYIVTADGVSIYFAGDTGETEEMAKMAASCTKTSGQSLPSSTICRTASKCPIARESRFKTCFVDS